MSKFAWLFLCLTAFTGVLGLGAESPGGQTTAFIASGVLASLLLLTLIVGRRIKFDPVLR
ncbi:PA3371 family protein [Pseudomonas sp. CHM02]|uniref:PA3371 family protein n=1 Tax=Pseudomonas sp. CHM02 TaxID=1463662 RepID=UPI0004726EDD|nr:PA3371 family protein [Pseudomonas sp. CHM02]